MRLGLGIWPALKASSARAGKWNSELESLNTARNAIAHDDQSLFQKLPQSKYPITLTTVKTWRSALNGLAREMDVVVGDYLATLVGGKRPW
ncbi:hypothetical protein [Streptomyces microflavus]|uniref:RiboL-PSP-HEPN domain-containing protein n=1 Tax=Streptomyces microflavus TaxID=1919 RepID=A0ABV1QBA6_STRMI